VVYGKERGGGMKGRAAALSLVLLVLTALLTGCGDGGRADKAGTQAQVDHSSAPAQDEESVPPAQPFVQQNFTQRRTINYVSCDPPNNALLSSPPERVTINFSKGLGAGSFIEVTRDGMRANRGQVMLTTDNRSMYVEVAAGLTGNYQVRYAAYFASGYYEEGSFGFSVKLP
jgi:methionine-rich copper-binding protein CopC